MPRAAISAEERGRMVRECLDAILAQRAIPRAPDLLVRALAERIGTDVPDAERLVSEEVVRGRD